MIYMHASATQEYNYEFLQSSTCRMPVHCMFVCLRSLVASGESCSWPVRTDRSDTSGFGKSFRNLMPQQQYPHWGRGCGGGSEGVGRVWACPALTGTFNLNMKASDVPTLSVAPCVPQAASARRSQLFLRAHLPAISHHPVIWANVLWSLLIWSSVAGHHQFSLMSSPSPTHIQRLTNILSRREETCPCPFLNLFGVDDDPRARAANGPRWLTGEAG